MVLFVLLENGFHWLLSRAGVAAFSAGRSRIIRATDDPDVGDRPGVGRILQATSGGLRLVVEATGDEALRRKFEPMIEAFPPDKRPSPRRIRQGAAAPIARQQVGAALVPMWARDP